MDGSFCRGPFELSSSFSSGDGGEAGGFSVLMPAMAETAAASISDVLVASSTPLGVPSDLSFFPLESSGPSFSEFRFPNTREEPRRINFGRPGSDVDGDSLYFKTVDSLISCFDTAETSSSSLRETRLLTSMGECEMRTLPWTVVVTGVRDDAHSDSELEISAVAEEGEVEMIWPMLEVGVMALLISRRGGGDDKA